MYRSWDISISGLEAAILDFPLPVWSVFIFGQYFNLPHSNAEPRKCRSSCRNFVSIYRSRHITSSISEVAILGFPLSVSSCSSPTSAIDMQDPKNVRVANEILYLASIEARYTGFMSRILWNIAIFGFAAAILDYWKVMEWSRSCYFVAQSYSRKITKAHLLIPSGYKMA